MIMTTNGKGSINPTSDSVVGESKWLPLVSTQHKPQGTSLIFILISIITYISTILFFNGSPDNPYDLWLGNQWPKYHIPIIPLISGMFCVIVSGMGLIIQRRKENFKIVVGLFSINILVLLIIIFVVGHMVYLQ